MISFGGGGWASEYKSSSNYTFDSVPDLKGKFAIVTGATGGLGLITVRELVGKGAHVVATAKNELKGQAAIQKIEGELKGNIGAGKLELAILDLSSLDSTNSFVKKFQKQHNSKNLDILILNAGLMVIGFPYQQTIDGFETHFGANYLGHFLLTKLLMPQIKKSGTRVVVVSALAHENTYENGFSFNRLRNSNESYNGYYAYAQSKLANILFSNELAERLSGTQATSNSLDPGIIKTELSRYSNSVSILNEINYFSIRRYIYQSSVFLNNRWIIEPFLRVLELAYMNADMGALTQLYVATSPELKGVTGKYFGPIAAMKTPSSLAMNVSLQKALWQVSEKFVTKYK